MKTSQEIIYDIHFTESLLNTTIKYNKSNFIFRGTN